MKRTVFLFPGQGSVNIKELDSFYKDFTIVKETFTEAEDIVKINLVKLLTDHTDTKQIGTDIIQPLLLTSSIATYKVFMDIIGENPVIGAGHSLGEFSALTAAGVINFNDALKIVKLRGEAMMDASLKNPGSMWAVLAKDTDKVKNIITDFNKEVYISNFNSKSQIVVAGLKENVKELSEELKERGYKTRHLDVSGAFHTPYMRPAAEKLRSCLDNIKLNDFNWPVISNLTGDIILDKSTVKSNLFFQTFSPVRWDKAIDTLRRLKIDTAIEMNSGNTLSAFLQSDLASINCGNSGSYNSILGLKDLFSNEIDEKRSIDMAIYCLTIASSTPNGLNPAGISDIINCYKKLESLVGKSKNEEASLELLKKILINKNISERDIYAIFNKIVIETGSQSAQKYREMALSGETI